MINEAKTRRELQALTRLDAASQHPVSVLGEWLFPHLSPQERELGSRCPVKDTSQWSRAALMLVPSILWTAAAAP